MDPNPQWPSYLGIELEVKQVMGQPAGPSCPLYNLKEAKSLWHSVSSLLPYVALESAGAYARETNFNTEFNIAVMGKPHTHQSLAALCLLWVPEIIAVPFGGCPWTFPGACLMDLGRRTMG